MPFQWTKVWQRDMMAGMSGEVMSHKRNGKGLACAAAACLAGSLHAADGTAPAAPPSSVVQNIEALDLNDPELNPTNCPAWAKEAKPDWVKPFMGFSGTPVSWRPGKKIFGSATQGIDRYQANQFVFYRPETADYLYKDYTPLQVNYKAGTLPAYEKVAAAYTAGCKTETEKAVALLTKAMPAVFRHPGMPPLGPAVKPSRNLGDEALLVTGCGWCNEQARVFIRLCQVLGIQARMIHLFGQNHTVAEFYADGRWALADASNFFVSPGQDGKLLSAAQCHDRGDGQRAYAEAKQKRMRELAAMTDEQLGFKDPAAAVKFREQGNSPMVEELAVRTVGFGVMNCPMPGRVSDQ
jgi:hypothetical protein